MEDMSDMLDHEMTEQEATENRAWEKKVYLLVFVPAILCPFPLILVVFILGKLGLL